MSTAIPTGQQGRCPVAHGSEAAPGSAHGPLHSQSADRGGVGLAAGGAEGHHGYLPFDLSSPFGSYARMRQEEPVMYDERIDYWVITKYEDIKAVFDNWEVFSSENTAAPVRGYGDPAKRVFEEGDHTVYSGLSSRRPPEHTRIRAIVQKAFTPRRFKVMEPMIRQNVQDRVDAILARPDRQADLLRDLAYDIPTITILTLVGADPKQVDQFKQWSDSRSALTWVDLSDEDQVPHAHNLVAYWKECRRLVAHAHEHGGDNLVADIVRAQQDGAEISDHEIASVCYSLLFAGHETTTTLISNTFRELLARRDVWQQLVDNPKLIPSALDEVLRFSPSIVGWRRRALEDTEVGGVAIPKGANMLLLLGSANRDEDRFEDGETFDISRPNAREHLSFGFGIHYCLGNMLAKLQAKICVEEVADRAPQLQLDESQHIDFRENLSFRTPFTVPVRWDA